MKSRTQYVANCLIEDFGHHDGIFFAAKCLGNEQRWNRHQDARFWEAVVHWIIRSGRKCHAFDRSIDIDMPTF